MNTFLESLTTNTLSPAGLIGMSIGWYLGGLALNYGEWAWKSRGELAENHQRFLAVQRNIECAKDAHQAQSIFCLGIVLLIVNLFYGVNR